MSAVTFPPHTPRQYRRVQLLFSVLFLLGLFSYAAVATVAATRANCENVYLTADDGVTQLTGDNHVTRLIDGQQCRLVMGGVELQFRLHLPEWAGFVVLE
jgi:hypothetical protein